MCFDTRKVGKVFEGLEQRQLGKDAEWEGVGRERGEWKQKGRVTEE